MRRRWRTAIVGAFFAVLVAGCSGSSGPQQPPTLESLIAPGATVKTFASGLAGGEGPLSLPDGRLIVSEIQANDVVVFDEAGKKSNFRRPSNVANGHALDSDGSVVEAEAGDLTHDGGIARIAADGSVAVLVDNFKGNRFNAPNDVIVKRDGTIWFTDPAFNASAAPEIDFHGVYRLDPKSKVVTLVTKTFDQPNGIAFSPDEKTLYVSDSSVGVYSFPVAADDSVGPGHVFGSGCDGVGVDELGNVWASTCGLDVVITDPSGTAIGKIAFPGSTTNLAWGGTDGKTLFVTTADGVYSLDLTVRETH